MWHWHRFVDGHALCPGAYAIVLLNTPITQAPLFQRLWNEAAIRVAADGGANQLRTQSSCAWPTLICGDLDSITDDTQAYFREHDVPIEHIASQCSTDLQKSIQAVEHLEPETLPLVIYGGIGSRLDHSMHTLHVLSQLALPTHDVYADAHLRLRPHVLLVTGEGMTCLVTPGTHLLRHDRRIHGKSCGLLPLGVAAAHIHTQGLEWNLRGEACSLGGFLSTSNHLVHPDGDVHLTTDAPIYWTIELQSR